MDDSWQFVFSVYLNFHIIDREFIEAVAGY
jgi:hypothetical protein